MVFKQNKSFLNEFKEGVSWWFVFKEAENPLLSRLLKPGYQHVFALTKLNNVTLAIEPMMGVVNHILTDAKLADMLTEYKLKGFHVVHFRHTPQPKTLKIRTPMFTCASYLAYTVGISFFGITPWQLHRKLIKHGGEEI